MSGETPGTSWVSKAPPELALSWRHTLTVSRIGLL